MAKLKLTPERNQGLININADEALNIIKKAAESGDKKAAAWLNGEGYIAVTKKTARFMFWDERYAKGRLTKKAIKWRNEVFKRDNYTCQECGKKGQLNAHHIKPWAHNENDRYDLNNGITLCLECHARKHPERASLIKKARYYREK
jgi:hypothetical protein